MPTKPAETRHEIDLGFARTTDARDPIVPTLTIRDETGEVIHRYELSEHDYVRMTAGSVIRAHDTVGRDMDAEIAELRAKLTNPGDPEAAR